MRIEKATAGDVNAAVNLMMKLWPGHDAEERAEEMAQMIGDPEAAILLASEEWL